MVDICTSWWTVQVAAHYELLQELGIAVPPMEFAAFKTMEGDVLLMQDAVYSAEANRELHVQRFKVHTWQQTDKESTA